MVEFIAFLRFKGTIPHVSETVSIRLAQPSVFRYNFPIIDFLELALWEY